MSLTVQELHLKQTTHNEKAVLLCFRVSWAFPEGNSEADFTEWLKPSELFLLTSYGNPRDP